MTLKAVSAGDGYRYFSRETAQHDGIGYYAGEQPRRGRWLGAGLADLSGGQGITAGSEVTEEQLARLYGAGADPETGEFLGHRFRTYRRAEDRRADAEEVVDWLAAQLDDADSGGVVAWREATERFDRAAVDTVRAALVDAGLLEVGRAASRGVEPRPGRWNGGHAVARLAGDVADVDRAFQEALAEVTFKDEDRNAVAGWDHTFSPPKSFSALWAVADDELRDEMMAVHEGAWRAAFAKFESDIARTRSGKDGVAATEVSGVVAVAFDHSVSRLGDPQPHTHVVVSSKVRTSDGRWMAIDGQPIYAAVVSLSERYQTELEARATAELGVRWAARGDQRNEPHPIREMVGVDEDLIRHWSARRRGIEREAELLEGAFRATNGRGPTAMERRRIAQQACLRTRPAKPDGRAYGSQREEWRATVADVTGRDWRSVIEAVTGAGIEPASVDGEVSVAEIAEEVLRNLEESRSWWTVRHVESEASRVMRDRGAPAEMLGARIEAVTEAVMAAGSVVSLEPDQRELPIELAWPAGGSIFRPADTHPHTSTRVLAAEDQLLAAAETLAGPVVTHDQVDEALARITGDRQRHSLSADQAHAVRMLAAGGGQLAVLVGPAGTGKTTTMSSLEEVMRSSGYRCVGLAPSAAAANVLGDEVGIDTATLDQMIAAHTAQAQLAADDPDAAAANRGRFDAKWGIDHNTVVIVDEASLAPTPKLAWLHDQVVAAGAKMVLVGDQAQLAAVEAGGAMRMLTNRVAHAQLDQLHRFTHEWEAAATLAVRDGDTSVIDTYRSQGRISDGDRAELLDLAYAEWTEDGQQGLLLAATNADATALNERAQRDRIAAGLVDDTTTAELADHATAGEGDIVVTRRNASQRQIRSASRVTNGDRWRITQVHGNGAISVRHLDRPGKHIVLPADYVREHVQLGYASTVHRAQGLTTTKAWALITPQMDRSLAYVAISRGKELNRLLVVTDDIPDWDDPAPTVSRDGDRVLAAVLGRESEDALAATDIAARGETREQSLAEHVARFRHGLTLASRATAADARLVEALPAEWRERLTVDPAWPALASQLASIRDAGDNPARWLRTAIDARELDSAESAAEVLTWRLKPIVETMSKPDWLPEPSTGSGELGEWLHRERQRIAQLAAAAEPDAAWRRGLDAATADAIAIWRAENDWHNPERALPAQPPARPGARRGWIQLRDSVQRTRPVDYDTLWATAVERKRTAANLDRLEWTTHSAAAAVSSAQTELTRAHASQQAAEQALATTMNLPRRQRRSAQEAAELRLAEATNRVHEAAMALTRAHADQAQLTAPHEERQRLEVLADQISRGLDSLVENPRPAIVEVLGESPDDAQARVTYRERVRAIESYRLEQLPETDPDAASPIHRLIGSRPDPLAQPAWDAARHAIDLDDPAPKVERTRGTDRGPGIER